MKTVSSTVLSLLESGTALAPSIVVRVDWPTPLGTKYYGDKSFDVGSIHVEGRIGNMDEMRSAVGADWSASHQSVALELIDPGGDIYFGGLVVPSLATETAVVRVYLYFDGTNESDLLQLMKGKLASPIGYAESSRRFSAVIVADYRSAGAAIVLDQELDASVPDESDGKVVPLAFGVPIDVPALLFRKGPVTHLLEDIDSNDTSFKVESDHSFPTIGIKIRVEDEYMNASVDDDTVTVSNRNVINFAGVTANRPSNDPDKDNPFVLWITDESKNCINQNFIIAADDVPGTNSSQRVNLCLTQKGAKLTFQKPWTRTTGDTWIVPSGIDVIVKRYAFEWLATAGPANSGQWQIQAGAQITQNGQEFKTYIVSSIPANDMLRVRAWRTYQHGKLGLNQKRLVYVPADYYTANNASFALPNDEGNLVPVTCTRIHFPVALEYLNQGWDDSTIFVTIDSQVGTNAVDQIEWLLENRTTITPDPTTFAAVRSKVSKYRADHAVLDDIDALELAHTIAYQSRIAMTIQGGVARLRYLSQPPAASLVLRNDRVDQDSYRLVLSDVSELKTVTAITWRRGYTGDPDQQKRKRIRKNVKTYGVRRNSIDYRIYQKNALVGKSGRFWGLRNSRTWKLLEVNTDLRQILLDPFDGVELRLNESGAAVAVGIPDGVIAEVHASSYDSELHRVRLLLWLPMESGGNFVSPNAYLSDASDSALADPEPKTAKKTIARVSAYAASIYSEPLQQALPAKILKVISTKTAEIELYPSGLTGNASGTGFLTVIKTPPQPLAVNQTGLVWQNPNGGYVSDVFAQ